MYYSFILAPNYTPNEEVNKSEIRSEYDSMVHWMENRQSEKRISTGVQFALAYYPGLIEINENRLDALTREDYESYARWTADWYLYQDTFIYSTPEFLSYNHVYYGPEQDYPLIEGSYWYREIANRYKQYIETENEITLNLLEERTGLQSVYRLLNTTLVPVILIAVVVFFSNDIVIKDRKHLSITRSFPLSFTGKLWIKTFVILTATMMTFLGVLLLILLITSLQNGFGTFSIPVSIYDGLVLRDRGSFDSISLGLFYIKAIGLVLLITYLFIRVIIMFSILIRNEFFNLLAGLALIFTERLYYMRGIGFFSNVDLYPSTFFPVGQVISGYQNHLYNSPVITFQNGVISLAAAIIVIELIILILTRFRNVNSII